MGDLPVPDSDTKELTVASKKEKSWPTQSIMFLADVHKALKGVKDNPAYSALAKEELYYLDMAAAIISDAIGGKVEAKLRPDYDAIIVKYGRGMEAVEKLAATLKEVAEKQKAQDILNKVMANSKVNKGPTVSKMIKDQGPFGYKHTE